MEKKNIPYALVALRAACFIPIILSTFNVLSVTLLSQLLLTGIIMISDIFDGKISRKYNDKKNKLRFRILDSVTDKTGIGLCLAGLIFTHRISLIFASLIIGYNAVLMSGGAISLLTSKDKEEKNVRGLFLSRLFTALTGLSIILLNNVTLDPLLNLALIIFMANIGANSLYKQLDDKIVQRREQKAKENEELLSDDKTDNYTLTQDKVRTKKSSKVVEKKNEINENLINYSFYNGQIKDERELEKGISRNRKKY